MRPSALRILNKHLLNVYFLIIYFLLYFKIGNKNFFVLFILTVGKRSRQLSTRPGSKWLDPTWNEKHSVLFVLKELLNLNWGMGVGEGVQENWRREDWGERGPGNKINTPMLPEAFFSIVVDCSWNIEGLPAMTKIRNTKHPPVWIADICTISQAET